MKAIDFYLSEMSVSDMHGGGITLQRVLGDDVWKVDRYVYLSDFAMGFPPTPRLASKSKYLVSLFEQPMTRRVIGCTASARLRALPATRRIEAWRAARTIAQACNGSDPIKALVCPQGMESIWTLDFLKRRRRVWYITWIMDDHVVKWEDGEWRYPPGFREVFARHLRDATTVFAISPVLAERYRQEFGVECEVMFGPADLCGAPVYDPPCKDGILTIGYFGRMWAWQLDALVMVAKALDPARERLCIYSPEPTLPEQIRLPGVELMAPVPKEAVVTTMRAHDVVLIPISFEDSLRNLSELNIATKMSECLASGTLTVVCGPAYAAMVKYLEERGAACCLTDRDPQSWRNLASSIRDPSYRRRVLDNAADVVGRELRTDVMQGRWRSAFERLQAAA